MKLLRYVGPLVFSLALSGLADEKAQPTDKDFAGWPAGWVEDYRAFEKYVAARKKDWPVSHLEISPSGMISHEVQFFSKGHTEHLSYRFFRDGRQVLGMSLAEDLFGEGRRTIFTEGTYAACLLSCGQLGYQHVFPITWFQVPKIAAAGERDQLDAPDVVPRLTTVDPPLAGEEAWPNERLLYFLDFHIFPRHHPWEIEHMNRRVHPEILLHLEPNGTMRRETIGAEAERLLVWRVYHNDRLIKQKPATGKTELEMTSGTGNYNVFLGVEGPGGFMPVSNHLEFPLFPDGKGGLAVIPPDEDGDMVPDFLEKKTAEDLDETPRVAGADVDNDGVLDAEEDTSLPVKLRTGAAAADRKLLNLWKSWEWDLRNRPPLGRDRAK